MKQSASAQTRFTAIIERKADDLPRFVILPTEVASALGLTRTATVEGRIADQPLSRQAAKPRGDGRWFLDVKEITCQKAQVDTGDLVEVELYRVSEEPPDDLVEALAAEPAAALVWDRLTRSQRRQVVNDVLRAKKPETRARRIESYVAELAAAPRTHSHKYGDIAP